MTFRARLASMFDRNSASVFGLGSNATTRPFSPTTLAAFSES
jgi:hypothetical protein